MPSISDPICILHVDDEPEFTDVAATFLEREDERFLVESATSPGEALDHLVENDVDCVVSDYDMPGGTGIEFLERVRELYSDIPFILFTGKGSEEIASEAISAGVTDYLQKEGGTDQYTILANRIANAVERRRAQRERRRHLDAIETAREGISILDEEGVFTYMNQAYAELYGYDVEELLGEHWERLYPKGDRQRIREEVLPTVGVEGFWHGETIGLRTDGSTFVEDHTLATTANGELVCTVRDISDRKQRERQLEDSVRKLEALFDNSPDMIGLHDESGRILEVNRRFCEQVGYAEEKLRGMPIWEIDLSVDPERGQSFWQEFPEGKRLITEGEYRRKDGSTIPIETHLIRIELLGTEQFLWISRDITDRKAREQELERQNARLERFASVVSHDLRNPLNVAAGRLTLARENGTDATEHLDVVAEALDRIERIVEDVLWLAREGKDIGSTHPVDLRAATRAAWTIGAGDGDRAELVVTDAGSDGVGTIEADEDRLRQLLENLFRNAIEHGGESVTVTVGGLADGFYVEDDGSGIPDVERGKLFEAGYSTTPEGTGFGLSIVKQIVDAHGWEIRVSDGGDGGARFEITDVEFVE